MKRERSSVRCSAVTSTMNILSGKSGLFEVAPKVFRQSQLSFAFGQAKWEWLLLEAATGNSDGQSPILAYTLPQNYLACSTFHLSKHFPSYPPGIRERLKRRSMVEDVVLGHNLALLSTFRPSMTLLLEVHQMLLYHGFNPRCRCF